jgi:hypothetical protein
MSVKSNHNPAIKKERNLLDYILYTLAGGVFAAISFSFLLWLRF